MILLELFILIVFYIIVDAVYR